MAQSNTETKDAPASGLKRIVRPPHKVIEDDKRIKIPRDVCTCPACNTQITACADGWYNDPENDGLCIAESLMFDCMIDFDTCYEAGKYLTQTDWMQAEQKALNYINARYRYKCAGSADFK